MSHRSTLQQQLAQLNQQIKQNESSMRQKRPGSDYHLELADETEELISKRTDIQRRINGFVPAYIPQVHGVEDDHRHGYPWAH